MIEKLVNSKKIAIFGWPATGKSVFGKFISEIMGISLYSLDLIRWKYSCDGVKDDEAFLKDYSAILEYDSWIIEGNALDYIDSRLEGADILLFFESSVSLCIKNYLERDKRVRAGEEERINFDSSKDNSDMISWIENRYSKKIEKLRPRLDEYSDKLIVINNYDELNKLINDVKLMKGENIMDKLDKFLVEAKIGTYANASIEKVESSRMSSNDYEYESGNMLYHDTFFGGVKFIGEEIVYLDGNAYWGMNYHGVTLDEELGEEAMDNALRPALMRVGEDGVIPVRGPRLFVNGEYKYTFEVDGDLENFNGVEIVYKNDKKIFELRCSGGLIK